MIILVTGAAGFIGFHLTKKLLESGHTVIGLDNLNNYYDINLKNARLKILNEINLKSDQYFKFIKADLQDREVIEKIFNNYKLSHVVHLAAQAGVRYSISNPDSYIQSNLVGFFNIIDSCKNNKIEHFYMQVVVQSMEVIQKFHSQKMIK